MSPQYLNRHLFSYHYLLSVRINLNFFSKFVCSSIPYGRRKTKTKNQNLRVRTFVCVHHKKRPYNVGKHENRNLKFSFSLNLDYPSLWEDIKRR